MRTEVNKLAGGCLDRELINRCFLRIQVFVNYICLTKCFVGRISALVLEDTV